MYYEFYVCVMVVFEYFVDNCESGVLVFEYFVDKAPECVLGADKDNVLFSWSTNCFVIRV